MVALDKNKEFIYQMTTLGLDWLRMAARSVWREFLLTLGPFMDDVVLRGDETPSERANLVQLIPCPGQ